MTKGFDLLKTLDAKYIPLVNNGKAPAVAFKDKTFTKQELNEHYKQGGNFGLLCEHKFFVIDIDVSHGVDGMANFIKWLVEHNFDPKKVIDGTLVSQTATSGFHLIYQQDENHSFKQNIGFIDGVDIKASANNFIVVAPSRINGKAYHFVNEDMFESIPVVPNKLIELMHAESKQRAKKKPTKETQETTGLTFTNAFGARIMDIGYYLTRGFGNVGERNDNLFKWAIQARKSMTQESALNFALIANEHSDTPIDDEQEIDRTIDSAYQYEVSNTVPELPEIDPKNIVASIFDFND